MKFKAKVMYKLLSCRACDEADCQAVATTYRVGGDACLCEKHRQQYEEEKKNEPANVSKS
jgi:hypothetical protein